MASEVVFPWSFSAAVTGNPVPRTDEARVRAILNAIPQMVWSTKPDGFHDFYNDRWYEFTGVAHGSTDGEGWNGMFHPEDQAGAWAQWRRSLATGNDYEVQYRLRHHSGDYRWTLGRAVAVRGADGVIERWFGTCTDIHDLKEAESEMSKLAAIVEQSADLIGVADEDGVLQYINSAGRRLVGLAETQDAPGTPMSELFMPASQILLQQAALPAAQANGYWEGELDLRHLETGDAIPVLYNLFPVRDVDGRGLGYATTTRDLRETKRSADAVELIARELSHRIKNIFSVVSSLVSLSAKSNPTAEPFAEAVRARIAALAHAHEYVRPHSPESRPNFDGQTVQGLLGTLLSPYQEAGMDRIAISGHDVRVGVRSATSLALVFHELATNAVKYGALSGDHGTVAITCERAEHSFSICWRERGGPEVDGAPARRGFGTKMSQRVVTAQLEAQIDYDWNPAGLTVHLTAPLTAIVED